MGYYTGFGLHIVGKDEDVKRAEDEIRNIDCQCKELVEEGCVYAKWYDWEYDMKTVAKNNPDVLIILSGDGEESSDFWEARFKGEEFEMVQYELPPFTNENLLTEAERIEKEKQEALNND